MARKDANPGKKEAAIVRRSTAVKLRMKGNSFRAIAHQLGISVSQAYIDVREAVAQLSAEEIKAAAELRQLESERLDMALAALMPQVEKGHLGAIAQLIKISERRSKLFGLDNSVKQIQEVGVTHQGIDPAIADDPERLQQEIKSIMAILASDNEVNRILTSEEAAA